MVTIKKEWSYRLQPRLPTATVYEWSSHVFALYTASQQCQMMPSVLRTHQMLVGWINLLRKCLSWSSLELDLEIQPVEKGLVQIREESTCEGMSVTLRSSLRQTHGPRWRKLNKTSDAGASVSQINSTHGVLQQIGKFMFKRLVHLDECYYLKLPFSLVTQLGSYNLFIDVFVTVLELESLYVFSFLVYHSGVLFTKSWDDRERTLQKQEL